jgi:drug/metabolite transporter (DMT)-like permease
VTGGSSLYRLLAGERWRAYLLIVLVVFALGINWPFITIGLDHVSPWWFVALRMSGAAVLIGIFNAVTGRLRPPPREDVPVVASVALGRLTVMTGMVFVALQFVPAGRSAVLVWTASLWTVPIAAAALHERMSAVRWVGLVVGISGIVALVEPWSLDWSDGSIVFGHALLLAAAVLNASVTVHIRSHRWHSSPRIVLPWQMFAATGPLAVIAFAVEGPPAIDWTWGFAANLLYQSAIASAFAQWAQQTVLQRMTATSMNLSLMAVPVVGLVASVIVLDERLTAALIVGVVAIVGGVVANVLADATADAAEHSPAATAGAGRET